MLRQAILAAFVSCVLLGCSQSPEAVREAPQRIVSLDYCADQYVLKFAERDHILAVSHDAQKDFSYLREQAKGLPQVRPRAADILALEPDLVVRSYGGEPTMAGFLERAGVRVIQLGFPGSLSDIRTEVIRVGSELGNPDLAQTVAREMNTRLATVAERTPSDRTVLYITPGGVTTGKGTLVHELITTAGYQNFQDRAGWNALPLERLAYERPDLVAAAYFDNTIERRGHWSATRHPIAEAQLRDLPVVSIDGSWTACGGWFQLDVVEALVQADEAHP